MIRPTTRTGARILRWTPATMILVAGSTHSLAGGPFGPTLELSSLNGANGFVLNGIDEYDLSGSSVSSAGDINGDGVDDLIIGAPFADPNGALSGESYVVFGSASPWPTAIELSSLDGTNGFIINGIGAGDLNGRSVSSAGDINGDGVDDLIIGAPDINGNGESYVVFGGEDVGAGGALELSSLNGTNGFMLNGIDAGDQIGWSVSSAGDVNGDGIDDFIIGAPFSSPNEAPQAGETYVVFGSASPWPATIELSSLNGVSGFVLNGIDAGGFSGWSVSSAGDVNGDGVDDLIIGAPNGNGGGQSYVIFGGEGVGAGGALELSSLDGTNGFVLNGINVFDQSGRSVSGAGDVNGDGVDDLIIGDLRISELGSVFDGKCLVVFGGAGIGSGGSLELSSLDGTNGFIINDVREGDGVGLSVSTAGDLNSDGFTDMIIGAYLAAHPHGALAAGESYVVFGGANVGAGGALELSSLDGTNGFVINGIDEFDISGWSVASAGDINGDGADDIIIGAPYADPNGALRSGESYVVFGRCAIPDLNADNAVDTEDLGILIGQFGTAGPDTDLNGDGVVDTADLGLLIGAFGTSCP